jgi:hypothetical protein
MRRTVRIIARGSQRAQTAVVGTRFGTTNRPFRLGRLLLLHTHKDRLEAWWDVPIDETRYCRVFIWKDKYALMAANNLEDAAGY